MAKNPNILIICGPTASGKTGLALQLAKELPKANILSVDSRQVYRSLDIVTGKDVPEDLSPHISIFGQDLFSPTTTANLGDFTRFGQKIIKQSIASNTPLIIVGGTGLYLKSLTQNLSSVSVPPNPVLRQKLEKLSLVDLQELLHQKNPQKFTSLNHSDLFNPRRLIRAIEIASVKTPAPTNSSLKANFYWVGLLPDKTTLKDQIRNRVQKRLDAGAVTEVSSLLRQYPDRSLPIFTSLGVSQICAFLNHEITQDQLVDIWTNVEVDYARRQIVWFKKQPDIVWYDKDTDRQAFINQLKSIFSSNA